MNCMEWEERLALYAGGDLPAAKVAEVERHLGECAGCQVFASGLREGLELLQGAHTEIPEPVHFAAVRSRVLAELERRQRPFWRRAWVYGFALTAVALLVAVAVRPMLRVAPQPPRPPQVATVLQPPVLVPPSVEPVQPVVKPPVKHRPRPKAEPGEPVLVRLVTDNPDVVIYWISERRGDY
ncbi:MAG TPA: zf-HC2 domain-containing protein [Bryobacteraceae bacterium]